MEFMQRGAQSRTGSVSRGAGAANLGVADQEPDERVGKRFGRSGGGQGGTPWSRVSTLVLLFAGTVLVIAVVLFLVFGKGTNKEETFVSKDELQAVFINVNGTNGGQVYFGHIKELTQQYIRLQDVFYIQNQQNSNQSSNSAYNLVKLGCELHGPQDQMVINRSEVFFWENLKSDSQVAQKVDEFHKQNPDGQKCTTNNSSANQSSTNTQTPSTTGTTNNATTNNATTNTGTTNNKTTTGQ